MELKLIRTSHRSEAIDGTLKVDGERLCDTAENAITSLPEGKYRIIRVFCKQYYRFVPKIMLPHETENSLRYQCATCHKQKCVSNNTTLKCVCHQLKMGNGIHHRADGSILLGTAIIPGCLKYTREPYENLSERLRKLDKRNSCVTLTIT